MGRDMEIRADSLKLISLCLMLEILWFRPSCFLNVGKIVFIILNIFQILYSLKIRIFGSGSLVKEADNVIKKT